MYIHVRVGNPRIWIGENFHTHLDRRLFPQSMGPHVCIQQVKNQPRIDFQHDESVRQTRMPEEMPVPLLSYCRDNLCFVLHPVIQDASAARRERCDPAPKHRRMYSICGRMTRLHTCTCNFPSLQIWNRTSTCMYLLYRMAETPLAKKKPGHVGPPHVCMFY